MSANSYDGDYTPALRHACSAGGYSYDDEAWVILSWYGTIHKLR